MCYNFLVIVGGNNNILIRCFKIKYMIEINIEVRKRSGKIEDVFMGGEEQVDLRNNRLTLEEFLKIEQELEKTMTEYVNSLKALPKKDQGKNGMSVLEFLEAEKEIKKMISRFLILSEKLPKDMKEKEEEKIHNESRKMSEQELLETGKYIGNILVAFINSLETLPKNEREFEKEVTMFPFKIAREYLPNELRKMEEMLLRKEIKIPFKDEVIDDCIQAISVFETDRKSLVSRIKGVYPMVDKGVNPRDLDAEFSIYKEIISLTTNIALMGASDKAKGKLVMFFLQPSNISKVRDIVQALRLAGNKEEIGKISISD